MEHTLIVPNPSVRVPCTLYDAKLVWYSLGDLEPGRGRGPSPRLADRLPLWLVRPVRRGESECAGL